MKIAIGRKLMLFGFLLFACTAVKANDYDVMYQRLYDGYLATSPRADSIIWDFMTTLQADGSWSDIDYDSHVFVGGWKPMGHWDRLFHMALAYSQSDNVRYKHTNLKAKIKAAVLY